MDKEQLDAIATRESYCAPFETRVAITGAERDELVALARDGMRYQWLRRALYQRWFEVGEAEIGMRVYGACPDPSEIDSAIDAAMAKIKQPA